MSKGMVRTVATGMVPVTVSFTHAQLDALEELARCRGCSVSAIVRETVSRGLGIEVRMATVRTCDESTPAVTGTPGAG
jgi:hypothetical protein